MELENKLLKQKLKNLTKYSYNQMDFASVNGRDPVFLISTYDNVLCENILKIKFNEHFELVQGHEFFKGNKDHMDHLFLKIVYEFNNEYRKKHKLSDFGENESWKLTEEFEQELEEALEEDITNELNDNVIVDNNKYMCKKCGKSYTLKKNLKYHLEKGQNCYVDNIKKIVVNGKSKYCCNYCNNNYSRKNYLQKHIMKTH